MSKKFSPKGKDRKGKGNALENNPNRMKIRPERAKSDFLINTRCEYNALSGLANIFILQTQGVALRYHICPRWGLASALRKS